MNMHFRKGGLAGLSAAALVAGSLALTAPNAQARVNVDIGLGLPFIAPPVVVAPSPYYAPPRAYYAPSPYYYYGPAAYPGGFWVYDRWGHRHWHRR